MNDPWNSLEIARLSASLMTPLMVAFVGFLLNRRIKTYEQNQWTNQKIVDKRLDIYDKLVPYLNDVLCFYCYIGNWKEIGPKEIIQYKRVLDKSMSIYKPLFDTEVWKAYNVFIHLCFETSVHWENDATIRSSFTKRAQFSSNWDEAWYDLFSDKYLDRLAAEEEYESRQIDLIMTSYTKLMNALKNDIELFKHESVRRLRIPKKTRNILD